jgi:D-2-hydroxyacid dehydrogenase (NADP+)
MRILIIHPNAAWLASEMAKRFPDLVFIAETGEQALPESVFDADAIVAMARSLSDAVIGRFLKLRWIQALTTGTDGFWTLRNLSPEVLITSVRGIHGAAVSEMVFTYMLTLSRQWPELLAQQHRHAWKKQPQFLLHGKAVAVLGTGVIAEGLAARCKAFGMRTIGISAHPRAVASFDEVLGRDALIAVAARADYLIALVHLDAGTRNLVSADIIRAMRKSSYLINISRGGVCDEVALLQALQSGAIAGAALDVFSVEPLPADSPMWDAPNLLITPHLGGESDNYLELVAPILERNISCMLRGRAADMTNLVQRPA